jgi:S1-C subfamily serine protease
MGVIRPGIVQLRRASIALLILAAATVVSPALSQSSPTPTPTPWEETVVANNAGCIVFITIEATRKNGLPDTPTGTGFIVSAQGYVLTCNHVVPFGTNYKSVKITGAVGGRQLAAYQLERIRGDEEDDLCLLRLPYRPTPWPSVQCISNSKTGMGTHALALGFPMNLELQATQGIITSTFGEHGRWMTDIPVNPGTSGGPVFNNTGGVVAVVRGGRQDAQNINELIPISFAGELLQRIGSPAITTRNQAVQRSAEELANTNTKLEESWAVIATKQLSPSQSSEVDELMKKATTSKATWNTLYTKYLNLSRTKPGSKSASDRQQIVTEMKGVVAKFDMVNDQVSAFAH